MNNVIKKYFDLKKILFIFLGGLMLAISVNYFIMPVGLYTGGLTGLILIIDNYTSEYINFGALYFIANVPLLILGWFKLGKRFTFYSILAVFFFSLCADILPTTDVISDDKLIMSLFGGVITGVGVLFTLTAGGSAGGMDILVLYMSERTGRPMGQFALAANSVVILLTALLFNFEIALYTLICSYTASVVIDKLHTRYRKLTVTVIIKDDKEFLEEFLKKSTRGVTIIPAKGAFSGDERKLLYVVITSYELTAFVSLVKKHDKDAFINVSKSEKVLGNFSTPNFDDM